MTYQETVEYLFSQLPMYQRVGSTAYKKDLSNTTAFCKHINNPHLTFKSVHVAGTNGKGSTSHLIASVLQEAGYKTGLYTSPHIKDYRERIKINGAKISEDFIIDFVNQNKEFSERLKPSFFEWTVVLAFEFFKINKVDVAIIETGLGGRLDSTNVITPLLSVITNISLDHTSMLGNTIAEIAFEKAGIIKPEIPVHIGRIQNEAAPVFSKKTKETNSQLTYNQFDEHNIPESALLGNYQKENTRTAFNALELLKKHFNISRSDIENGFQNVVTNTKLLGRFQILQKEPLVICDVAHNNEGLKSVMSQLLEYGKKIHFVLGFVNDKTMDDILPLFPHNAKYYYCCPKVPRGLSLVELKSYTQKHNLKGSEFNSVKTAYIAAKTTAKPNEIVYVGGSTFTVAEII